MHGPVFIGRTSVCCFGFVVLTIVAGLDADEAPGPLGVDGVEDVDRRSNLLN
jgi:hypothetical protein